MAEGNGTGGIGFLLKGLWDWPEVRFAAFDAIYSATLLANGGLLLTLRGDHRLHTPMYVLLATLSFWTPSAPWPRCPRYCGASPPETGDLVGRGKDVFLLAVTASEHRLAVLRPLHYAVLMDGGVCVALVAGDWPARFLNYPLHASFTFTMTFCLSNLVDQYYSDVPPVTGLSRSGPFYVLVAGVTLRSRSAEGKRRTSSTCTSCLLAVGRFYGPAIFTYIRPSCGHSPGSDGLVGMLYGVLNPLIDSLRNEKVKGALRPLLRQKALQLVNRK
ncbi:olfactory receptor 5B21-like [Tachyglossus aculeatus]|uniref:olfactory receptor 5B21-like n=1 Tax=Tachyglossus aculeatus TaxID=9261 RepID=UPI0018F78B09|nr:olfactory receptor 5B21-like [Tachyglossus aculeatus]